MAVVGNWRSRADAGPVKPLVSEMTAHRQDLSDLVAATAMRQSVFPTRSIATSTRPSVSTAFSMIAFRESARMALNATLTASQRMMQEKAKRETTWSAVERENTLSWTSHSGLGSVCTAGRVSLRCPSTRTSRHGWTALGSVLPSKLGEFLEYLLRGRRLMATTGRIDVPEKSRYDANATPEEQDRIAAEARKWILGPKKD